MLMTSARRRVFWLKGTDSFFLTDTAGQSGQIQRFVFQPGHFLSAGWHDWMHVIQYSDHLIQCNTFLITECRVGRQDHGNMTGSIVAIRWDNFLVRREKKCTVWSWLWLKVHAIQWDVLFFNYERAEKNLFASQNQPEPAIWKDQILMTMYAEALSKLHPVGKKCAVDEMIFKTTRILPFKFIPLSRPTRQCSNTSAVSELGRGCVVCASIDHMSKKTTVQTVLDLVAVLSVNWRRVYTGNIFTACFCWKICWEWRRREQ